MGASKRPTRPIGLNKSVDHKKGTKAIQPSEGPDQGSQPQGANGAGVARRKRSKTTVNFGSAGLSSSQPEASDVSSQSGQASYRDHGDLAPVAGWLVIVEGPGRGASLTVLTINNSIGRGPDNRICLDFGDSEISREAHAYIAYDAESRMFIVASAGHANLVRLNGKPLLSDKEIVSGDELRIGQTKMLFRPFCGPDFDWNQ